MFRSMYSYIAEYNNACDQWNSLESVFTASSKSRKIEIRNPLQGLRKGNLWINEYMEKAKELSTWLAIVDDFMSKHELILYITKELSTQLVVVADFISKRELII